MKRWLLQNDMDVDPYLKQWTATKNCVSPKLIEAIVHCLSYSDGLNRAIEAIHSGMGLDIDINPIKSMKSIDKILELQIVKIFLESCNMSNLDKQKLWNLTLRKEYDERTFKIPMAKSYC
jgi:hypothetical protein